MGLHRAGGKFSRNHTTIIDAAVPLVDAAEKFSEVTKISLGEIKVIGKGLLTLKFYDVNGGLKLVVRGNISRQEVYIYTSDPDKTKSSLTDLFTGKVI